MCTWDSTPASLLQYALAALNASAASMHHVAQTDDPQEGVISESR